MFVVFAVSVLSWGVLKKQGKPWLVTVLVIGLTASFLVTTISTTLPPVEQEITTDTSYRTFPSFAYPFSLEQYRDWGSGTFYYMLVFTGTHTPVFQSDAQDDQSEFIHMDHLIFTSILGLLSLLGAIIPLLAFVSLEKLGYVKRDLSFTRMDKRVGGLLCILEIIMLVYLFAIGSIFTASAGVVLLLFTAILTIFPKATTN